MFSPNTLSPKHPQVKLEYRPSRERGTTNIGWLKAFMSFSAAHYYDARYVSFGSLRIINEDRVAGGQGFGTHGHREMEIFTYIVSGAVEHKDSMGNIERLKRGDIQLTSAGTGIQHSEYNGSITEETHYLQIWALPSVSGLTPKYYTRHFSDAEKTDKLVTVVAPKGSEGVTTEREGSGPAPIHSALSLKVAILSPGKSVEHVFPGGADSAEPKAYIQVVQTSGYNTGLAKGNRVRVNGGLELAEGDAAFAWGGKGDRIEIENAGDGSAEVLVFDIE